MSWARRGAGAGARHAAPTSTGARQTIPTPSAPPRAHRSVPLANAMLPHDVQDAHSDGITVTATSRQPRQADPGKQAADRVARAASLLHGAGCGQVCSRLSFAQALAMLCLAACMLASRSAPMHAGPAPAASESEGGRRLRPPFPRPNGPSLPLHVSHAWRTPSKQHTGRHLVGHALRQLLLHVRDVLALVVGVAVPVQLAHGAQAQPSGHERHALWACTSGPVCVVPGEGRCPCR